MASARTGIDTAEAWVARLSSPECSAQDRAEFKRWLERSPGNVQAYADAERIHYLASALAGDPGIAALGRAARRETDPSARSRRRWYLPLAFASIALLALGLSYLGVFRSAPEESAQQYATAIGERRTVVLADGSRLTLDADTRLETAFAATARRIRLAGGRIDLDAAHDVRRPLVVEAGNGAIRVTGTAFQVERTAHGTSVGLLRGQVEVSAGGVSLTLHPGQLIAYDEHGRMGVPGPLDVKASEGWKRGLLILDNRRLDALLEEMNRYSDTRLTLAQPELGAIAISGTFRVDDRRALLDALREGWGIRAVQAEPNQIELTRAP